MNFGSWGNIIHEDSEQTKRIAAARKADTTPASLDRENNSASFKGSGKNPYVTTFDSCTCGDFIKRKLPCKHIYRLALELQGADVQVGTNKNERKKQISEGLSALSFEAQSLLFDMAYIFIGKGLSVFFLNRTEHAESLLKHGFCVEHFENHTAYADYHNKDMIIDVLQRAYIYGVCPAKSTRKNILHNIIFDLEENRLPDLQREIILLELAEQSQEEKHVIHRNLYKVFYGVSNEDKRERLNYLLDKGMISKESYNQRLAFLKQSE